MLFTCRPPDTRIPFAPLRDPAVLNNPYILMLATAQGGHVAFLSANRKGDEDRFWAENRVIEFCRLVNGTFRIAQMNDATLTSQFS